MKKPDKVLDKYKIKVNEISSEVAINSYEDEPVPIYTISLLNISHATKIMLDKVIQQFVAEKFESLLKFENETPAEIVARFKTIIKHLLEKYFPGMDHKHTNMLINYVLQQNIGLGNIEILLKDENLEEIVINNSTDPVWVYHRNFGWLRTNIIIHTEDKIRQYATMIGRDTGKEITTLHPFLDAHLQTGDRVNSTLQPISTRGNTITIRKFAVKPWTITDFIKNKTVSLEGAALIWTAMQNELSIVISGGTASGKTSMLNGMANFLPPNQRIISIEDTRELMLPKILHWVPMETRLANPEGKGGVTMLDLVVNSLRMRPDRIMVGEIRRKEEAEVLFEAMHTGHSVYGTLHANNVRDTITRLTSPPMELPKTLLSAIGLVVVQHLNRRISKRRTFQIAEVLPEGDARVLMQYDPLDDKLKYVNQPSQFFDTISLFTGLKKKEIIQDMSKKISILKIMVKKDISNIHDIGLIMSKFYRGLSVV